MTNLGWKPKNSGVISICKVLVFDLVCRGAVSKGDPLRQLASQRLIEWWWSVFLKIRVNFSNGHWNGIGDHLQECLWEKKREQNEEEEEEKKKGFTSEEWHRKTSCNLPQESNPSHLIVRSTRHEWTWIHLGHWRAWSSTLQWSILPEQRLKFLESSCPGSKARSSQSSHPPSDLILVTPINHAFWSIMKGEECLEVWCRTKKK